MTEPTKAGLQAENARLAEENRQLRDLLAAVRETVSAVPRAVFGEENRTGELDRWRELGTRIRVLTDATEFDKPYGLPVCARQLRGYAAEPVTYRVQQRDEGTRRLLADLAAVPRFAEYGEPVCGARSRDDWDCNAPRGHAGHHAHWQSGIAVATWPQAAERGQS